MASTAHIGLGSNIEPEANLRAAVRLLDEAPGVRVQTLSAVYGTPPWGPVPQADYLNAAAALETALEPLALLELLLGIETARGRDRGPHAVRWGPRTLDLDLLLHGERVMLTPRLTLPHPRLHERAFALVPLCDLAPDLRHPVLGRTLAELLAEVDSTGVQRVPVRLQEASGALP
jgi:2-amino-4-hydroxy-6-hydroxymethyldihydropteridine diphosphokinase